MDQAWRSIGPGMDGWPEAMGLLNDRSPSMLWIRGALPLCPALAIVGTRTPDASGLEAARCLSRAASLEGLPVASGGALGIDTAAHEACIEAGGRTIVVMATGPDVVYPARNAALFDRVVESGGAVVSEHPPGTPVAPYRFLERNRLLAALASGRGVVVVQARLRSGALSTAAWADKLGVEVYALPGSPLSPLSAGPNSLIASGRASMLTGVDVAPGSTRRRRAERGARRSWEDRLDRGTDDDPDRCVLVARLLGCVPTPMDAIVRESGLGIADVAAALLDLELEGKARLAGPEGWIRLRGRRAAERTRA